MNADPFKPLTPDTARRPIRPPNRAPARAARQDNTPQRPLSAAKGAGWGVCPQCGQSCTGKYLNALGCTRCGWNSSGITRRASEVA